MRGLLLLMEHLNDWDLQAVVRSCASAHPEDQPPPAAATAPRHAAAARQAEAPGTAPASSSSSAPLERTVARAAAPVPVRVVGPAARPSATTARDASLLYDLEYLDLDRKPFLLSPSGSSRAGDDGRQVMISFPAAAAASTSGVQPRPVTPGRKPGARILRPKRSKKSQLKKVVREMPVADGGTSSSDPWAWRKYGQKPIKGSPYPRGYYKCSSMKGCMARKLVERSPAKPGVLVVTYMAEHCHPVPTQLNSLAGTTRHHKSSSAAADDHLPASSPKSQGLAVDGSRGADEGAARCGADDGSEAMTAVEAAATADDEEFLPAGMTLDELLADDDFDFEHVLEEDGALGLGEL